MTEAPRPGAPVMPPEQSGSGTPQGPRFPRLRRFAERNVEGYRAIRQPGYWRDFAEADRVYDPDTAMGALETRYWDRKIKYQDSVTTPIEWVLGPYLRHKRKNEDRDRRHEQYAALARKVKNGTPLEGLEPRELEDIYVATRSEQMRLAGKKMRPSVGEAFTLQGLAVAGAAASLAIETQLANPTVHTAAQIAEATVIGGLAGVGAAWDMVENYFDPMYGKKSTNVSQNVTKGRFGRKLAVFAGIPTAAALLKVADGAVGKITEVFASENEAMQTAHTALDILSIPAEPKLLPVYFAGAWYGIHKARKNRRGLDDSVRSVKSTILEHNTRSPGRRIDLGEVEKKLSGLVL